MSNTKFLVEIDLNANGSWVAICNGATFTEDQALAEALDSENSGEIVRLTEVA